MLESVRAPEGVAVDRNGLGVEQDDLITAAEIIAEMDRGDAHDRLRDQRVAGDVVMYAFQNPEEVVRLPGEDPA